MIDMESPIETPAGAWNNEIAGLGEPHRCVVLGDRLAAVNGVLDTETDRITGMLRSSLQVTCIFLRWRGALDEAEPGSHFTVMLLHRVNKNESGPQEELDLGMFWDDNVVQARNEYILRGVAAESP